jgi:toluene monooxygenase system ferredoxin subunit
MSQLPTEDGQEILVLNSGSEYFACQPSCPHLATPLEEGMFDGRTLMCHQHFWQWDIATGRPEGPAERPLKCFRVKFEDGSLYVWNDD